MALSRNPSEAVSRDKKKLKPVQESLLLLEEKFPDLETLLRGKRVADFGSGVGNQSVALGVKYDCTVVGIENNPRFLKLANEHAKEYGVTSKVNFISEVTEEMKSSFDVVISQNSFEHFYDSAKILEIMKGLINENGKILITFGPPWFAPRGCHMQHMSALPWMNLIFSERTVMNVRSHFRSDGARYYHEVESGLNQMSLAKFEPIIKNSGLNTDCRKYDAVKDWHFLTKIPVIRELFTNNVTVVLSKPVSAHPLSH